MRYVSAQPMNLHLSVQILVFHTLPYLAHGVPNKVTCHIVTQTLLIQICSAIYKLFWHYLIA